MVQCSKILLRTIGSLLFVIMGTLLLFLMVTATILQQKTTNIFEDLALKSKGFADIKVSPEKKITVNQTRFLSNDSNKMELIKLITTSLKSLGCTVKQAPDDADTLIVKGNNIFKKRYGFRKLVLYFSHFFITLLVLKFALY